MTETAKVARNTEGGRPGRPLVDDDLADQLLGKARAEGAEPLGPDGLLSQVIKAALLTDVAAVDLAVPRDRAGMSGPQIARKGQTCLEEFNDRIIALYARGTPGRVCGDRDQLRGAAKRQPGRRAIGRGGHRVARDGGAPIGRRVVTRSPWLTTLTGLRLPMLGALGADGLW